MPDHSGVLYIVATPLGNLGDMSQRAIETLGQVDLIAAEDTRHSKKLLVHFGIDKPMIAFHEHNERDQTGEILRQLAAGRHIALISDAGTPLISDPGYQLVRQLHEAGIRVVPIPGPSAVITALCAAGLATDRFCFEGFLPSKAGAREKTLQALARESRTLVFYESPHRLLETLRAMLAVFGPQRRLTLARELTKTFETIHQDNLANMVAWVEAQPEQQKGESVLVVEGATVLPSQRFEVDGDKLLLTLLSYMSVKDAAHHAAQLTGQGKNELYQRALEMKRD
ncbi:MAG: 16S rRNA (cytidine(1402)-2'-O)-methyltransferase [Gammaproteobacteria bacterium]|nr:16S rRNA (cytidine(1402)-2'-O)-methyltransferase [Gammaproteobacteria bacterium]